MLSTLLEAGSKVDAVTEKGVTPLMLASIEPDPKKIEILLASGADVNARARNSMTPLMFAAFFNIDSAVISQLIEAGADIDDGDHETYTAIMQAATIQQKSREY